MLLHYLKIAIRNLSRQRLFTGINIFGLALSMSICLIVLMRIKDDFSYDRFHPDADHTYRIITEVHNKEGNTFRLASSPLPLAPDLKAPITPLLLRNRSQAINLLNVRTVSSVNTASLIPALEKTWKSVNPFQPFKYSWFGEDFYVRHSAVGTSSFLSYIAAMTITLACMGLLGMVIYTTEPRKKEIGIRKVMAAGVAAILSLLTRNRGFYSKKRRLWMQGTVRHRGGQTCRQHGCGSHSWLYIFI